MRREYLLERACPKACGSSDMRAFTYCCADSFDIVCQACGAVEEQPVRIADEPPDPADPRSMYNPLWLNLKESVKSDIGFIGKKDVRKEFHEMFPDKIPPVDEVS